ncbi:hypothetical protein B6N58_05305 [Legionella micdadei]|uniref:Rho GTPase (Miro-like) n=2 Tax=Legionella micdadei TaxID=451 RepID=A0A098GIW9_LEGMI|nr:hypothetical protein B6N58_05305 [Legionella micdadei]KTD29280.1 Rho GTPase (Miro-like) [Legionella micdadei]CEG61436.1 protein of unknown function [RAS-RELATED GTPASE domain] [Legionella micdadei]SCY40979.1 hypothetical protein SAMN02982997_01644 [Legionella micdadei]
MRQNVHYVFVMTIRVVVFGVKKAGNSNFVRQIERSITPEQDLYNNNKSKSETNSFEYIRLPQKNDSPACDVWIMHHVEKYITLLPVYYTHAHIGLYCLDLSKIQDDNEDEQTIIKDIIEYRKHNPNAPLILVGTKRELCEDADSKISAIYKSLQAKLDEMDIEGFAEHIAVSDNDENLTQFPKWLESIAAKKKPLAYSLLKARNKLPEESVLYQALDHFIFVAEELDLTKNQMDELGKEACLLIRGLKTESVPIKSAAIETFSKNCHRILKDEPSKINKAVDAVVAAAIATLFVFGVGFTLGCAAGVWTGPFALLTGIATGSAAAITLLAASGTCGVAAGSLSAFGFFRETPLSSSVIEEVAEAAKTQKIELIA